MPSIRYHLQLHEVDPAEPSPPHKHESKREGDRLVLRIPFDNLASGERVEFQVPEGASSAGEVEIVWDVAGGGPAPAS
jgi:hypothetical protein